MILKHIFPFSTCAPCILSLGVNRVTGPALLNSFPAIYILCVDNEGGKDTNNMWTFSCKAQMNIVLLNMF